MTVLNSKQRKALPSSEFGIPSKRAFPLNDKTHVLQAIRMFNRASVNDRAVLIRNLAKAMRKFNITVSKKSFIAKHLPNDAELFQETAVLWSNRDEACDDKKVTKKTLDFTLIFENYPEDKIYFDSDIHLKNSNYLQYEKNQRSVVGNDDVFIFLGDITDDQDSEKLHDQWFNSVKRWNGKIKILILGNNDVLDEEFYKEKCGFDEVILSGRYKNLLFTHIPIKDKFLIDDEINIHGHLHDGKIYFTGTSFERHFNVYTKFNQFKPISLKKIKEEFNKTRVISERSDFLNNLGNFDPLYLFRESNEEICKELDNLTSTYDYYLSTFDLYKNTKNYDGVEHLFKKLNKLLEFYQKNKKGKRDEIVGNHREPWLNVVNTYYNKGNKECLDGLVKLHSNMKSFLSSGSRDMSDIKDFAQSDSSDSVEKAIRTFKRLNK